MRYSDPFWSRIGSGGSNNLEGAPILSEIYHQLIFGGKVLDDDTYEQIQRIFLPEQASQWQQSSRIPLDAAETLASVKLHGIETETRFDEVVGAYRGRICLRLLS